MDRAYDQVWLIEDDVFVPAVDTLVHIDRRYPDADLLSASNLVNPCGELRSWYWWRHVPATVFQPPWAKSMMCAVRFSRQLLDATATAMLQQSESLHAGRLRLRLHARYPFVYRRRALPFIEYFFHTLALHQGLSVVAAEELGGIVWRHEWTAEEIGENGLFHPVKQPARHAVLRAQLSGRSGSADESDK